MQEMRFEFEEENNAFEQIDLEFRVGEIPRVGEFVFFDKYSNDLFVVTGVFWKFFVGYSNSKVTDSRAIVNLKRHTKGKT